MVISEHRMVISEQTIQREQGDINKDSQTDKQIDRQTKISRERG